MLRRCGAAVVALVACASCVHELEAPAPSLTSLVPALVCSAQAVTLAGANLTPLPTRTLASGTALTLPTVTLHGGSDVTPPVRWESEQQMIVDLPGTLPPGLYDVVVANPDGETATLPGALAAVAPPSVSSAPPQICDSQADQTVTLTGQGFLVVGAQQPSVSVSDATGAVVLTAIATASGCSPVAAPSGESASACTTLSFTVAKNALTPGDYTLHVIDPPPAACQSLDATTLTITRGRC